MIIELTGVIFTRIKSGFSVALLTPERVLAEGDILLGVGTAAALKKAAILIGPRVEAGLQTRDGPIEHRDLVVTNKELIGRRVFEVNHDPTLAVVVSRVRRGYIQLPVGPATTLEFGDQIRIVAWREQIAEAAARFGDPIKDLSETDFLSISLGIILGLLLGMVPFPLPGGHAFRFGAAGGPLLVALVLGKWGRSGPVIWTLPTNANLTLRQLGLHLFLAGIGVKAGGSFLPALVRHGLQLFFCGAVLTLVTATVTLTVGYRLLKIDMVALLGLTAGVHTQPAALAFAGDLAGSDAPNLGYATVHPLSFVVKLVLAQALVLLL